MVSHINQGTALVTGASTGIGAVYADRLAARLALGPNLSRSEPARRYSAPVTTFAG
jgi:short-subunit dehydrogenase